MQREIGPFGIALQSLILKEYYTNINTDSSLTLTSEGIDLSEVREEFMRQTEFNIYTKFNEFICGCICSALFHRINSFVLLYMMEQETEEGKEFIASLINLKMKIISNRNDCSKIYIESIYKNYPEVREHVRKYVSYLLPENKVKPKYIGHIGIEYNKLLGHTELYGLPEKEYSEDLLLRIERYQKERISGVSVILLDKPFMNYGNLPAPLISGTNIIGAGLLALSSLWISQNPELLNENYDT